MTSPAPESNGANEPLDTTSPGSNVRRRCIFLVGHQAWLQVFGYTHSMKFSSLVGGYHRVEAVEVGYSNLIVHSYEVLLLKLALSVFLSVRIAMHRLISIPYDKSL